MIMSEWQEYRLGDVCEVFGRIGFRGYTTKDLVETQEEGAISLSPSNIIQGELELSKCTFIKWDKYEESPEIKIQKGDIIFVKTGSSYGRSALVRSVEHPMTLNPQLVVLKNIIVNPIFLSYVIKGREFQGGVNGIIGGSAIPTLSQKRLAGLLVKLPSRKIQDKISEILLSIDSKIENNRKICANLEAQAQALFKHWFIDFAPFKDGKFVESELGMIPEGLIYKRIEDMPHTLETGKRPAGGVKGIDNGVPSIGAENIKGLGCYDYSKTKYVIREYYDSMKKGKIHGYELLVYKDGGKPGYFIPNFAIFGEGYPYKEMCLNEHVFKLDFGNKGYSLFAYFFFKTKQIMSYLNAQGAKAAIPGINSKDIEVIMMPTLENECVRNYCNEVEDILTQILVLSKESSRLSSLRDTLLPKLMSGEIKV